MGWAAAARYRIVFAEAVTDDLQPDQMVEHCNLGRPVLERLLANRSTQGAMSTNLFRTGRHQPDDLGRTIFRFDLGSTLHAFFFRGFG